MLRGDLVAVIEMKFSATASLTLLILTVHQSHAQDTQVESGRAFAQSNCASCHAIGAADESRLPEAPPFRALHERYPVEDLAESLAEGIKTSHPMPEFQLDGAQVDDLIAYLKSLER
jgi:cytochrome c